MPWWVIPEGAAGQAVGQLVHDFETGDLGALSGAGAGAQLTVTESAGKPAGEVAGPYGTQAQAQAQANTLNGAIEGSTTPTAANAASAAANDLGIPTLNGAALRAFMVRALKVVVGLALVVVGVIKLVNPEKAAGEIVRGAVLA
jgi:hypothetical protein